VTIDHLVLNIVLATGVTSDQIKEVEELLLEAENMDPSITDVVSYNTLIKGYANRGGGSKTLEVLDRMRDRGVTPSSFTFNTVIDALVRSDDNSRAWELLSMMRAAGLQPDKFTCSILVKSLTKTTSVGQFRSCLALLAEVGNAAQCHSECQSGTKRRPLSVTGSTSHALDPTLQGQMYHSVLEAAALTKDTDLLAEIFVQMRQRRITVSSGEYHLLIKVLGQKEVDKATAEHSLQVRW